MLEIKNKNFFLFIIGSFTTYVLEIHEGIELKVAFDSWDQNEEFYKSFQSDENVSIKKVELRNEEVIKITIHERVKTLPLLIAKSPEKRKLTSY